ncbi:sensor histidine kinase [Alkalithermobacter paradoxus]|uniref:histidine kinase n=1 Tax=Alkalithermobacter paradoxus TaxID=29349 RepID=A0A1V4I916_9FIRM|nr:sensor histidine kinase GlnK [[Clostridium] thermoalcaliphilum]
MNKIKKMLLIAFSIALISQVYINLFSNNFRISLAVIFFPIFLLNYSQLNVIATSIITSFTVFIFRSVIHYYSVYSEAAFIINYPVIFFYILYGIGFYILDIRNEKDTIKVILSLWICDFISNLFEVLIRTENIVNIDIYSVSKILAIIALIRVILVFLIITLTKHYKLLLMKEEHEERYRKLILLISSLKSEIYLMNKNIDNIELVMNNAFKLYKDMSDENANQTSLALSIAKDVHEIKKDYIRVIRGIEELTVNKIEYTKMSLKDIFYILEDSTSKYISAEGKDIDIIFQREGNFYTKYHYTLISILRNLIQNSIESIDTIGQKGTIMVRHFEDNDVHNFIVYDNGKGIKQKDIDYIFNPGFSTKFNNKTGDINRGLGLTLVKDIVENEFSGRIKVNSQYEDGTIFEIKIPKIKIEYIKSQEGDGDEYEVLHS